MGTVEAPRAARRAGPGSPPGRGHRLSTHLYRRPKLVLLLLLGIPLLWLVVVYLGSLSTLILQSFFWLDSFTGQVVRTLTLANYVELGSRHADVRFAGLPSRLLHGAIRLQPNEGVVVSIGAAAAVVVLPGAGLCLALDPGSRRDRLLVVLGTQSGLAAGRDPEAARCRRPVAVRLVSLAVACFLF